MSTSNVALKPMLRGFFYALTSTPGAIMNKNWYAIHLALPMTDDDKIKFEIRNALPLVEMSVFFDGDSFTTWGEPIEEGEYEHYIIKFGATDSWAALTFGEFLYRYYAQRGLAVSSANARDPRWTVSDFNDWSIQF